MVETTTPVRDSMHSKLTQSFAPVYLEIIDESENHRGHGGWREGGETHFRVVMRSAALNDLSRVGEAERFTRCSPKNWQAVCTH